MHNGARPAARSVARLPCDASARVAYRSSIAAVRDKATVGWIDDDEPLGFSSGSLIRKGSSSMPPVNGQFVTETLSYDGGRQVTVYVPAASPEAIIFSGDGQLIAPWGEILESADVPPTMVVGAHRLDDETLRIHEYSAGESTDAFAFDPQRFAAHEKFFVAELRRWAQLRFDLALSADRTAVCECRRVESSRSPWDFAIPRCTVWSYARRLAPVTDHPL